MSDGLIAYDWEWNNGTEISGGKPWASQRLVDLIGVDYFGHVTEVWLAETSAAPDSVMEHVGRLTRLQRLGLTSTHVSDAGLKELGQAIPRLTIIR